MRTCGALKAAACSWQHIQRHSTALPYACWGHLSLERKFFVFACHVLLAHCYVLLAGTAVAHRLPTSCSAHHVVSDRAIMLCSRSSLLPA